MPLFRSNHRILSFFLSVVLLFDVALLVPKNSKAATDFVNVAVTQETNVYSSDNPNSRIVITTLHEGDVVKAYIYDQHSPYGNYLNVTLSDGRHGFILKDAIPQEIPGVVFRTRDYINALSACESGAVLYYRPNTSLGSYYTVNQSDYTSSVKFFRVVKDCGDMWFVVHGIRTFGYVKKSECVDLIPPAYGHSDRGTILYKDQYKKEKVGAIDSDGYFAIKAQTDTMYFISIINVDDCFVSKDDVRRVDSLTGFIKDSEMLSLYRSPQRSENPDGISGAVSFPYFGIVGDFYHVHNEGSAGAYYIERSDSRLRVVSNVPIPRYISADTPTPSTPSQNSGTSNSGSIKVYNYNFGTSGDDGIKMKVTINGKEQEVLLGLNNFTYDYETPETVSVVANFQLRKGANAAYGAFRRVKKGEKLTIVGRDREWLIVDMGGGKKAYILEGMTSPVQ